MCVNNKYIICCTGVSKSDGVTVNFSRRILLYKVS